MKEEQSPGAIADGGESGQGLFLLLLGEIVASLYSLGEDPIKRRGKLMIQERRGMLKQRPLSIRDKDKIQCSRGEVGLSQE